MLPAAFVRRCFVLHLKLPDDRGALEKLLVERARVHFQEAAGRHERLFEQAARLIADERALRGNASSSPFPGRPSTSTSSCRPRARGDGRRPVGPDRFHLAVRLEKTGKPRVMSHTGFTRGLTGRADLVRSGNSATPLSKLTSLPHWAMSVRFPNRLPSRPNSRP